MDEGLYYVSSLTNFNIRKRIDNRLLRKYGFDVSPRNKSSYLLKRATKSASRLRVLKPIIIVLEVLACFSLFYPIYVAVDYIRSFVIVDKFDNHYITHAFEVYDRRLGSNILPLKGTEIRKYRHISRFAFEWRDIFINYIFLAVNVGVAVTLFLFDDMLSWGLAIIRSYANRIDLEFLDMSSFDYLVTGSGPLSDVFRSFLSGFQGIVDPKLGQRIYSCIKEPNHLSIYYAVTGLVLYAAAAVFVIFSQQSYQWRNRITALSYRGRHQERVMWLHSKITKDRGKGLALTKKEVLIKRGERERAAALTSVSKYISKTKNKKCLVCGRLAVQVTYCPNCDGPYCSECWFTHGETCVVCGVDV